MAMKILQRMQCLGLEPNAITYGIYHRAIMQGEWPTPSQLNAIDAWKRIRFRVEGCSRFRAPLKNLAFMQQETSYAASASTNALSAFDTSAMESPHLSLNASNASLSSGISSQETESLSTNVQERDAKVGFEFKNDFLGPADSISIVHRDRTCELNLPNRKISALDYLAISSGLFFLLEETYYINF